MVAKLDAMVTPEIKDVDGIDLRFSGDELLWL